MSEIGEVWNIVTSVAPLFQNGHSQAMSSGAFACPNGVQPGALDWANSKEKTVSYSVNFTNNAREWFGASSGCSLRIGCTFQYGGTSAQHPGLYLYDAKLWAVLDYSSLGTNFTVNGNFGDAVPYGNSAQLSGTIDMNMTYLGMHWEQRQYNVRIRGNGYASIQRV